MRRCSLTCIVVDAMTLTINLTPEQHSRLEAEARRRGVPPEERAEEIVRQHFAAVSHETQPGTADSGDAASIALLESWLREDATDDPDAIRAAEEDLAEFKRAMNETRRDAGARILSP